MWLSDTATLKLLESKKIPLFSFMENFSLAFGYSFPHLKEMDK